MAQVISTQDEDSRTTQGVSHKEMGAVPTSWSGTPEARARHDLVISKAVPGKCYLKMVFFFNWFDDVDLETLEMYLMCLGDRLGSDPLGMALIAELAVAGHNYLHGRPLYFDIEEGMVGPIPVVTIYNLMRESKVRVDFDQVDGLIHLKGGPSICACGGPVCGHGWSYIGLSVIFTKPERRVGASGFNMSEFLAGSGMFDQEEEDDGENFENAYSQFELTEDKRKNIDNWVRPLSTATRHMPMDRLEETDPHSRVAHDRGLSINNACNSNSQQVPAVQLPKSSKGATHREEMSEIVRKLVEKEEVKRSLKLDNLKGEISELRRQLMSKEVDGHEEPSGDEVSTVVPNDSSTQFERYSGSRRFLNTGTVLTPEQPINEYGRQSGQTVLSVSHSLVSGFYHDDSTRQKESDHVKRLKPINGLPKPFLSPRLNFLANLDTGLIRCLSKYPDDSVGCLLAFMKVCPTLPVDNLLFQVLSVTIDRHEFVYASNPFKLPYIEIGMFVTEESIAKLLSLLTGEYKQLWFQEMKGLTVPAFHKDFSTKSHDPVDKPSKHRQSYERQLTRQVPTHRTQKRSLLGF